MYKFQTHHPSISILISRQRTMASTIAQQWGVILNMVVEDKGEMNWKHVVLCNSNSNKKFQDMFMSLITRCINENIGHSGTRHTMLNVLSQYTSRNPEKIPFANIMVDNLFRIISERDGRIRDIIFEGRLFLHRIMRYHISQYQAANVIINGCTNWLDKPVCRDGLLGVRARIGLREVCNYDALVPPS